MDKTAQETAQQVAAMPKRRVAKRNGVALFDCLDFLQYIGMAAHGALTEDDQRVREDVGPFDSDGDRRMAVGGRQQMGSCQHMGKTLS
ncbi:hypothetical protein ACU4GI_12290 [Cupriavidus basilensis]